ncbi:MAG: c-type cytochrome domain-containing protein, partial [Planctomycetaceae bacterium]
MTPRHLVQPFDRSQAARRAAPAKLRVSTAMLWIHVILSTSTAGAAKPVSFLRDVAPILARRCEGCHGQKHADGGLRVDSFAHLLESAAPGDPLIVPGDADASDLYQRLINADPDVRMPQEDEPLTSEQTDTIRRWIAEGAAFDGADVQLPLRRLMPPRRHPLPPERYASAIPVYALAFSPTGGELAVGGYHEVTIWDAQTGALVRRITGLPERIDDLEYSPGGQRLLVGGGSPGDYGELTLVDPQSGEQRQVFGTFEDVVLGVAFSRDGSRIAAACADQTVRVYDIEGAVRWDKRAHSDWVTAVSFSHNGRFLASSSRDMTVKVFEAATGELFTTYTGHKKQFGKHAGEHEVYGV